MAVITPTDLAVLGLRLLFALLLYVLVVAVLRALQADLRQTTPATGHARGEANARLVLLEAAPVDGPPGRVVHLNGETTIGRRPTCQVVLRDDAVSGRHARIRRRGRHWQVEDLGSTNGTFVNGARVTGACPLRAGDVLAVGLSRWQFDVEGT
jgi:pSer/pThr/pTyr-binding forkhead associated (FHA) protein